MKNITLNQIVIDDKKTDYFFSVSKDLQKYFKKTNHLFLEYNIDLAGIPNSILAIPFVANVIPLIWITDSTLMVSELDKNFYDCLNKIKAAYQTMFPNIEFKGEIVVNTIVENTYTPEHEVASLFSGGLDALTTFIRIKDKQPFLITEYGWHEDDIQKSDVWEADKENAINFAKSHILENILIQSNYGNFINAQSIDRDFSRKLGDSWWHGLHHGLAIISAAIPMAFKLKIRYIYIASSNSPLYKVSCASDPTVDNEIKYASGGVVHDGYELNRQDKVKVLVDYYSISQETVNVRVCFKNEENCCKCEKCLRTIMGIIAEGENPVHYGFNIPVNVSRYIKTCLNNEVKFFTNIFIKIYWEIIQAKMKGNKEKILYKDLLEWFLDYNFVAERKKSLLKYRVTKFFPIIKRKIVTKFKRLSVYDG
ncbi:peptidase [Gottfriedia solisilvae]|uniref:peptidase n=1 Tax=Gottfriedia solisilvae TaxID=1516104 RepID=UPI003D2F0D5B